MNLNTYFTSWLWEPLFWKIKRMPVLDLYQEFSRLQWDTPDTFKNRRKILLAGLLRHIVQHIPFYKQFGKGGREHQIDSDPFGFLKTLPILEKKDLSQKPEQYSTELGRGTFKNSSGGSTGTPVSVLQDNTYKRAGLASTYLFFDWAGASPGASKIKLWGAERDITRGGYGLKFHLLNILGNYRILNCFSMTPESMMSYLNKINAFKPKVVEGYVDALLELSQFAQQHGIRIEHAPSGVVTSAGTLLPHMRASIETIFQAPVFDRYGSREAGNMAAECSVHKGLHIMGETTILEIVDVHNKLVPPGEEGDILVTNLWNYTMPLIRYRIGDRGVISSGSCSCGRPYSLLEKISGRSSGCFKMRNGGVVSPVFFIHFIGVVHNDGKIKKFQIVQEDYDRIVVRIVPNDVLDLNSWPGHAALTNHIKRVMGNQCQVDYSLEKKIDPTPTGKHLYTVCRIGEK